jgi:hypothetical protein
LGWVLRDLRTLGLIRIAGTEKAKKVNTIVRTYEYTKGGQLLALIIKSLDAKHRENAINEIYDIAVKAFSSQNDSSSITISRFLAKCVKNSVFDRLVELMCSIVNLDPDPKLASIVDLFRYIFNSNFRDSQVQGELSCLWFETVQELDPDTRKIQIHQLKLDLERKFANNQEGVRRQYEELRFKLRQDYEKIALEGDCLNCKYSGSVELHYTEYFKIINGKAMAARCPQCGTQNLLISNL